MSGSAPASGTATPATLRRRTALAVAQEYGVWIALAVVLVVVAVAEPAFYRATNLQDVLRRASILGLVTVGQVLVLMTAGIDLSVGAMVGITAVAIAEAAAGRVSLPVALLVAAVVAIAVGLINGLLVTRRRMPPVVTTFGMFVTLEGVRVAYTRGTVSGTVPESVLTIGRGALLGIPWSVVTLVVLVVALTVLLRRSVGGRRLVTAGANERMAALSGIAVTRVKVVAYVACSLLAVAAGVFFAGYVGYVDRFIGRGMDLDSIAAALLGGTTFTGGHGSFVHAAGGALLIAALTNAIVVSGLNVELQLVAKGAVLIGAVALQTIPRRERGAPRHRPLERTSQ